MYKKVLLLGLKNYPEILSAINRYAEESFLLDSVDKFTSSFGESEVVLTSIYEEITADFLKNFPKLRLINVLGTSLEKIDLDYCKENHVTVLNVKDYCDHETAEWVIGQSINFLRSKNPPQSFYGKNIAVIGSGNVAQKVISKAICLGASVDFYSSKKREEVTAMGASQVSLDNIFSKNKIVSFHTKAFSKPLAINLLYKLEKDSIIINTCMGPIFHENELKDFLKERLDVTLIMDKIASKYFVCNYPNIINVNNLAFFTKDSHERLLNKFFANLAK